MNRTTRGLENLGETLSVNTSMLFYMVRYRRVASKSHSNHEPWMDYS